MKVRLRFFGWEDVAKWGADEFPVLEYDTDHVSPSAKEALSALEAAFPGSIEVEIVPV